MIAEHKHQLREIVERLSNLYNEVGDIRAKMEELEEDAQGLIDEHESWMDDHDDDRWADSATGQKAQEDHEMLEDFHYSIEEFKSQLESIEFDIDNKLAELS